MYLYDIKNNIERIVRSLYVQRSTQIDILRLTWEIRDADYETSNRTPLKRRYIINK